MRRSGEKPAQTDEVRTSKPVRHVCHRLTGCQDFVEIHGVEMNPGSTEPEHLGRETIAILVSKLNGCVQRLERFAPLATEEKGPRQVELRFLIGDAQIRILFSECF